MSGLSNQQKSVFSHLLNVYIRQNPEQFKYDINCKRDCVNCNIEKKSICNVLIPEGIELNNYIVKDISLDELPYSWKDTNRAYENNASIGLCFYIKAYIDVYFGFEDLEEDEQATKYEQISKYYKIHASLDFEKLIIRCLTISSCRDKEFNFCEN
ncbi:hypothetical protein SAMN05216349_12358 [Oribacterium sp. KHPX15]|uniref:hypothetical protein n=1 Tax=Oribacterium sp. KHPX15 TaxID=1855342 RepID=UPI00089B1C11|nr:hypothetical protein [Oribacterium sp. KHPX15]SEA70368.1 hypothetical protein SAMN05216349_12358 [Oribacterium sp. KHPX15]